MMNDQMVNDQNDPDVFDVFAVVVQSSGADAVQLAYDPEYGTRPIKRHIQRHCETFIAREVIAGTMIPNHPYLLDVDQDKIVMSS